MVDGVLLVVDAFDGPMPQTRFVLRKALALGRTPIVVINKIDRPGADPMRVHDEVLDLFIELEADDAQLDAPVVYALGATGVATMDLRVPADGPHAAVRRHRRARAAAAARRGGPFQMLVSTIDYSPYLGRMAIGRVERGTVHVGDRWRCSRIDRRRPPSRRGDQAVRLRRPGARRGARGGGGRDRRAGRARGRGDRRSPSPTPSIPERLEGIAVEEPTISVDFLVNNSPFAGQDGKFVTSRQMRERLYKELERNVALRVEDTDSHRYLDGVAGAASCTCRSSWRRCGARATSSRCRARG